MKNVWIIQQQWNNYDSFEIVAFASNKSTAAAIMAKVKHGDSVIIEKFPVLTSIKDFKEELWI